MQLSRYIKKIIKNQNFKARLNCSMHGLFLKISHLMFVLVCRNILLPRTFSKLIKLFIFCYALIMPLNCLEYDVTWKVVFSFSEIEFGCWQEPLEYFLCVVAYMIFLKKIHVKSAHTEFQNIHEYKWFYELVSEDCISKGLMILICKI